MADWIAAIILGLVEGLTEFIPVSSTGHLLLLGHFMGFESEGKTFEVVIQLGAILAIVSVYFRRLWALATRWPHDAQARHFIIGVVIVAVVYLMVNVTYLETLGIDGRAIAALAEAHQAAAAVGQPEVAIRRDGEALEIAGLRRVSDTE